MKRVIMFSGQGAQYSGMGRDFYDAFSQSRRIFDIAGDEIRRLCFEGSEEELSDTINTQVCMYTVTMAKYYALKEGLGEPYALAGFSLGEYAALTAGGAFSFEAGLYIVRERARLMAMHGNGKGGMLACIGDNTVTEKIIADVAQSHKITAANYNSPGQIVASGDFQALEELGKSLSAEGIKCIPLKVSGPFHSELLRPVAEPLRKAIHSVGVKAPHYPVYSNVTAQPYKGAEEIEELLALQVSEGVRWQQTIEALSDADSFVEVGCGKTLVGLVRKISAQWSEKKEIKAMDKAGEV